MSHKRKGKRGAVGNKISKLRHEGVKQDQAVAEALSMKRAGRLDQLGNYKRVGRKHRRGKSRA